MLAPLVGLLRPHQWYKNLVVFIALVFSGHAFTSSLWPAALLTFAAFCLLSGATYAWNDVVDAARDRRHPKKRQRPVASGRIRPVVAVSWAVLVAAAGLGLLWFTNPATLMLGAAFLVLQAAYNLLFKHQVLWDVLTIGVGFVLRALAGTTAIEVGNPTVWLILCTFLFALFLGFTKRRHELLLLNERPGEAADHRPILGQYNVAFLELVTTIVTGLLLASYILYTATRPWMMFTIPFAVYGVLRYLFLVHRRDLGDEPELLFRDRPTLANAAAWIVTVLLVLREVPQALLEWLQGL